MLILELAALAALVEILRRLVRLEQQLAPGRARRLVIRAGVPVEQPLLPH